MQHACQCVVQFWGQLQLTQLSGKGSGAPEWKQSAICTMTWNNSVLQSPKVLLNDGLTALCPCSI